MTTESIGQRRYLLQQVPLSPTPVKGMDLSPERLPLALRAELLHQDLAAGQILFSQNDPALASFAVETGRLRLVRHTREGKPVVFQVVRAGESFAESALFLDTYGCDAVAEVPSRVLTYPKQLLRTALLDYPALTTDFFERLVKQSQALQERLELRSIRSARDRVLQYLLNEARPDETTVHLDRHLKDIAGDLGLTAEVLYRTLARLEREGLIHRTKQQITLHAAA